MEQKAIMLNDIVEVGKRRRWSLIIPAITVFLAAAIIALVLPSIYKSTSTILIEEQDIPAAFVMTTVTSYAEQRLQSIHQRIVSFQRLLDVINRFNLYPNLKDKWTDEKIVEKMREDIILEPVSIETGDRRNEEVTIAFTLSYEGKNPGKVHQIANILTSMFLEENLQVREKKAKETSIFLENEMEKVKAELSKLDARMSVFKMAHINELPELLQVNSQSLNNVENNIERLNEQLRNLKEREGYLQTQLASIPPDQGKNIDKKRLDELKVQLVFLESRFSDQYPDVIKAKAEIAELEKRLYTSTATSSLSDEPPDNPAYITLASQLSSTRADIESIKRQIFDSNKTAATYRHRIMNTPKVEEAYKDIFIELNNTQVKYDDLMKKHMEAKVAQGLEKEQKGERFTLIDPARLPEKPYKPNRMAIMLIGFVLSVGAGVGWASLKEYNDQSIRDADSLTTSTSFPVLAVIPEIVTKQDTQRVSQKRIILIIAIILIIIAGLSAFHYLIMDVNVFWAKLMRKLTL